MNQPKNAQSGNILVALEKAQAENGYVPSDFIKELASSLDIPVSDVYGVASFYSFLSTQPRGRHIIRVCKSLPCHLKDGQAVINAISGQLGIKPGQTTGDGRYSFELTNCVGLCDDAPAMLVDHDVHNGLTPQNIVEILNGYK